ncbi:predicted protein [Lichtheimia corymbifera JMRC:FSU:9682]|uniref:Uncharacterized protein n=1 Tax=Lichtheimia corymbifera JMRC:FSU:9682 TaxID=1263082 RepID=A0A068S8S8_9FUNG|nr:predicted protein [Lichtheimia corymbifera JMRC:FSU:9682]
MSAWYLIRLGPLASLFISNCLTLPAALTSTYLKKLYNSTTRCQRSTIFCLSPSIHFAIGITPCVNISFALHNEKLIPQPARHVQFSNVHFQPLSTMNKGYRKNSTLQQAKVDTSIQQNARGDAFTLPDNLLSTSLRGNAYCHAYE